MNKSNETFKLVEYKKIGSLSLLKFLLAFLVFLFHWNIHYDVVYSIKLVDHFINGGAFAMNCFFILSGFLLYYIYSKKDFSDFTYLKNFYKKRLIKILPSCYLITLVMLILFCCVLHKSVNWTIILTTIIPIQSFFPHLFGEFLNGGLWFVSVLIFLYFLFPLLCMIVKSINKMAIFTVCIYLLGILPLLVGCYYPEISIYFLPPFRICEFVMGMITAKLLFTNNKEGKHNLLNSAIITIMIFFSCSVIRFSNYINFDYFLLILFPSLIYNLARIENKTFLMLTQNKFVDYLGNIAYAFFITQILCQFIVQNYFMPNKYFGMSSTTMLIVSFIINIVLAIIMYEFFDKKISNLLIKKFIISK